MFLQNIFYNNINTENTLNNINNDGDAIGGIIIFGAVFLIIFLTTLPIASGLGAIALTSAKVSQEYPKAANPIIKKDLNDTEKISILSDKLEQKFITETNNLPLSTNQSFLLHPGPRSQTPVYINNNLTTFTEHRFSSSSSSATIIENDNFITIEETNNIMNSEILKSLTELGLTDNLIILNLTTTQYQLFVSLLIQFIATAVNNSKYLQYFLNQYANAFMLEMNKIWNSDVSNYVKLKKWILHNYVNSSALDLENFLNQSLQKCKLLIEDIDNKIQALFIGLETLKNSTKPILLNDISSLINALCAETYSYCELSNYENLLEYALINIENGSTKFVELIKNHTVIKSKTSSIKYIKSYFKDIFGSKT